jgi:hypothetical protein
MAGNAKDDLAAEARTLRYCDEKQSRSEQCRIVSKGIGRVTVNVNNALKLDLVKSNLHFGMQLRCSDRRCGSMNTTPFLRDEVEEG